MKKFTKAICVTLAACFALTLSACGGGGTSGGGKNALTVWTVSPLVSGYNNILRTNPNHANAKMTKDIIETFENANPGVRINLVEKGWGQQLNQELVKAIAGGNQPDVTVGEQYVPLYIKNGYFEELDFSEELSNDIIGAAKAVATDANGKFYAAPVFTSSFALIVNKNVLIESKMIDSNGAVLDAELAEKNINPLEPEYWEDLLLICRKIKAYYMGQGEEFKGGILLSNTTEGGAYRALAYQRSAGGEISSDGETIEMDTPQNKKAFELMRDLAATAPKNSVSTTSEDILWTTYFLNKDSKAAYILDGNELLARSTLGDGVVTAVELPTFKDSVGKKSNVLVGSVYLSILKKSSNAKYDIAKKFLDYMMSEEVQLKIMKTNMRVPTRNSIINGEAIRKLDNYAQMQTFIKPIISDEYEFNGSVPCFMKNSGSVWTQYNYFLSDVLKSNKDISSLLTSVQSAMTKAYNS